MSAGPSTSAIPISQMDERGLRNFKEFLEVYNKISETCFSACAVGLSARRGLTPEEEDCADRCTVKNYSLNHRVLGAFMVEQPRITEEKVARAQQEAEEAMRKMQAEGGKAEGEAAPQAVSAEEMAAKMMSGMHSSVPNPQAATQ